MKVLTRARRNMSHLSVFNVYQHPASLLENSSRKQWIYYRQETM